MSGEGKKQHGADKFKRAGSTLGDYCDSELCFRISLLRGEDPPDKLFIEIFQKLSVTFRPQHFPRCCASIVKNSTTLCMII